MLTRRRSIQTALRIIVAGGCCLGIWCSWKLARADYLFHQDTEESIRSAIRLVPDGWEYYMRLAQFDEAHARELLATSLRLNRYDAQADIELGLRDEANGDFARAEKELLDAYDIDHTYLPRWSLANFYLRRNNMPAFWAWAQRAAAMPADDIGLLFELCWRATPDPEKISAAILNDNPKMIRQYVSFLMAKNQPAAVAGVTQRLFRDGEPNVDRTGLLFVVNWLIAQNDPAAADSLWHSLIENRWVAADATVPNNPEFKRDPLPVAFDWSLPGYQGLHSWPGPSGLETEFTGDEPEDCTIAEQAVVLAPGDYKMSFTYRTSQIAPDTGIRWQAIDANSKAVLAESTDLSSDSLKNSAMAFSVPAGDSLVRLRLIYRRELGTLRVAGDLVVQSTQLEALPKS